jgi:hypothetical protein
MIPSTTITTTSTTVSSTTIYATSTSFCPTLSCPLNNVTLYFTNVSGGYNYDVTYGTSSITGSNAGTSLAIPLPGLFSGETITIYASVFGGYYCAGGTTVTAQLFLDKVLVAQGTTMCPGSPIHLVYTV